MYIKEVAKLVSTTPRAIRFYEEKGLISPQKDTYNDYRYFTEKDILRLSTILALREIDVGVADIKNLLEDSNMSMEQYLDIQRAAMVEKWMEMKDMIHTIDQMVERAGDEDYSIADIHELAQHLKNLRSIRTRWQDKWNFDSWAEDFDNHIKREGHAFNVHQDYNEALDQVVDTIKLQPGDTSLDIGIGTGNLGSKLLSADTNVIGVDQSDKMLTVCNENHPAIETRKGHFLALPLLNDQVDVIVSSYALHHVPDEEKIIALEEMDRVLKPHGQICIADLMFVNDQHRANFMDSLQAAGNNEAIDAIEDEYYADQSLLMEWLDANNYYVETHLFNDILSMIYARK
ncbi:methyltransferase domain-containing protein [Virgibacillus sp. CBA3643]|uniref:methyltransferase domain-containing protein n=1 Tax=Virgibacillus sp. CBA3643 TaxID=2942278 RepID=UPI0035A3A21F